MAARKKRSRVRLERAVIAVLVLCIGAELIYWFRHRGVPGAHFIVGLEGEVLQCVPLSEVAYCSSQANDHTVSIEVCHADETGEFSAETMASLLRLTAWLCEEFDLAPADVIRHYDVTGKVCPKYYVDHPEAWEDFRSALRAARTQENPS